YAKTPSATKWPHSAAIVAPQANSTRRMSWLRAATTRAATVPRANGIPRLNALSVDKTSTSSASNRPIATVSGFPRRRREAMKIVLFGASGMVGSRIAGELEERGHDVTVASRSTGTDVTDPAAVASTAADADVVVSAV